MFASNHYVQADTALQTLIEGLGGFTVVIALVLSAWNLWAWRKTPEVGSFAALLFGLVLLSFAGLAALTTDHISRHLAQQETTAWQLWLAFGSFTLGASSLVALLSVRFDRSRVPKTSETATPEALESHE